MIKSNKESMFKSAWKDRYFVIASGKWHRFVTKLIFWKIFSSLFHLFIFYLFFFIFIFISFFIFLFFHFFTGALTYYAEQNDMFDLDKDCKGEIALANIVVVESTTDPKYRSDSVFDVHARVLVGGDSDGMRVFTFDARSVDNAEKWMRELCKATEILELKRSTRGVFSSSVSDKMVQARNSRRMAVNSGTVSVSNHLTASNTFRASLAAQTELDDDTTYVPDQGSVDADGTPTKSSQNPLSSGRGGGAGRGGNKRGGMGRGVDFRAGSGQSSAIVRQRSDSKSDLSGSVTGDTKAPGESYSDAYGSGGI